MQNPWPIHPGTSHTNTNKPIFTFFLSYYLPLAHYSPSYCPLNAAKQIFCFSPKNETKINFKNLYYLLKMNRNRGRHYSKHFANKMAEEHLEFSPFEPIQYFLCIGHKIRGEIKLGTNSSKDE
jgi:hypothetical protein